MTFDANDMYIALRNNKTTYNKLMEEFKAQLDSVYKQVVAEDELLFELEDTLRCVGSLFTYVDTLCPGAKKSLYALTLEQLDQNPCAITEFLTNYVESLHPFESASKKTETTSCPEGD
jgi:hypothetical protein